MLRIGLGWIGWLAAGVLAGSISTALMSTPAAYALGAGPVLAPTFQPGGEPLILASDGNGGIWYGGGATHVVSEEPEAEASIWHLTSGGAVTRVQLPTKPDPRFAEYFAAGPEGTEWFLADTDANTSVELGRVSPSGTLALSPIQLANGLQLRGLAVDPQGNLWSTESGRVGRQRIAAIVRITPAGQIAVLTNGLMPGAIPVNIAAAPDGTLWFLDAAGRVGHVLADGQIVETPIGRRIAQEQRAFAPSRPILVSGGDVWFVAGPETIARMSPAGKTSFITPRSSYRGLEAQGARDGNLIGLAAAPTGDVWFTRDSGEVGRIGPDGRVATVTNRLVNAFGIAFDGRGDAWVGEGPGYERAILGEQNPFYREQERQMALAHVEPARIAQIESSGAVAQFPPAPACRVPSLIGVERSLVWLERATPFGFGTAEQSLAYCEHRIRLTHVRIERRARRGRLFVIAQRPAPGLRTYGYVGVSITLAVASAPRGCRIPRPFKALFRSGRLLVWRVATEAPEQDGITETYYGCALHHGGIREITSTGGEGAEGGDGVARMAFAGRYVAYVTEYGSKYGGGQTLTVENLASGSETETETDGYNSDYSGPEGPRALPRLERLGTPLGRGVYELALAATGAVAWVGQTEARAGTPRHSVLYVRDHRGVHRLAVGTSIGDVRFSGPTVRWQDEGRERWASE